MVPEFFDPTGSDTLLAEIEASGTYHLWLRIANSTSLSSLKIALDSAPQQSISLDNHSSWKWVRAENFSGTPMQYDLNSGTHSILLTTATSNLHIDRLLLTPDQNYIPTGLGGSSATPKLTDADGLARRFVQLGQTAGPVAIEASLFYSGQPVVGSPVLFNITAKPGSPFVFKKISGDNQTGEIGVPLADPLIVGLYDAFNNPASDFPVKFTVTSGGGTINPSGTVKTNFEGLAQTKLTPGDVSTLQQVKVEADGVPGSPLIFTAAVQGVAHKMEFISGDQQTGTVKTFLPQPVKVKILTEKNEPVAGYPVIFTTTSGNGKVYPEEPAASKPSGRIGVELDDETPDSSVQILTGGDGIAFGYWELGKKAGTQRLQISADDLEGSPKQVEALALTDKPAVVLNMGGNNQEAVILTKLPDPLFVHINDQWGNPIEGQDVVFTSQSGGGTFNGNPTFEAETDALGDAKAYFTLGTLAGTDVYKIQAQAQYGNEHIPGSPVVYYASGLAGSAARLEKVTQESPQDTVNQQLDDSFRVKVTDEFGNAVYNKEVTFEVTAGNGSINGESEKIVSTNKKGIAQIFLTLGSQAGINQVRAFVPGLDPEQVFFTATAVHDVPRKLHYVSGSGQSAVNNSRLVLPFRVRVTDEFENIISGHLVTFQVKSEAGEIDGAKSVNILTIENGEAEVYLTLGTDIGDSNHVVHATSRFNGSTLQGSPVVFYASSRRGAPSALIPITSGTGLLGAAHSELKEPLKVKIMDARNLPYPNYPVTFRIKSGSGYFLPTGDTEINIPTDEQGFASARWVLGNAGENHLAEAEAKYENVHLENSPFTFKAIAIPTNANQMEVWSGTGQSGRAGDPLAQPFEIKITDIFNSPVGGHPVQFRVTKGGGYFTAPTDTMVVVNTNAEGLAPAVLTLGPVVGQSAQEVTVMSYNQVGDPLIGAPIVISINTEPAAFDPGRSEIFAQSPIPATGNAKSIITVIPRDRLGNNLPNRQVRLETSGMNATIIPLTGQTNEQGLFLAEASANNEGQLVVAVIDVTSGQQFNETAQIDFILSTAKNLQAVQTATLVGYPHSMLYKPVQVRVTDANNQPVENYPVTFSVNPDSASIQSQQPVTTNALGIASTSILLLDKIGTFNVHVDAPGLVGSPVACPVIVVEPGYLSIDILGGDGQSQKVRTNLPIPLQVKIHDVENRPAGRITVLFNSFDNRIAFPDSGEVQSDVSGKAQTTITLGDKAGSTNIMATIKDTQQRALFGVSTLPGEPFKMTAHSGDNQTGTAGDTLDMPLTVKVLDEWGNGVTGVPVEFNIQQGGGSFWGDSLTATNAAGLAQVRLILGPSAGNNVVVATSGGLQGSPVSFTIIAGGAKPAAMEIISGNTQLGVAGHLLNMPLQVRVLDELGFSVPDSPVTFSPDEDQGRILPQQTMASDSSGQVKVQWVLGPNQGKQYVNVSYENMEGSPLRFEAMAMPNSAPHLNIPDSLMIAENQQIAFTVLASDAERDTIHLGVRQLPEGASFDSTRSFEFKWRPGYSQAGNHMITFYARDHVGAITERDMKIRVLNVNRSPRILADQCKPAETNLGDLKKPGYVDFVVVAQDDDNDRLNYLWTVNGEAKSTTSDFRLQSSLYSVGVIQVTAWVFDASDTASISWNGDIISSVELKYFSGQFLPFQGVELTWETRRETDNLGFYVLKSATKLGPFVPTGHFFKSNAEGIYKMTDDSPNSGETWFYRLEDIQSDGKRFIHDIIRVDPPLPDNYALLQNYPNPFNPETTIRFELPEPAEISLVVFDVLGRSVRTLIHDFKKPGYHVVKWDGCNEQGFPVAAGVYYYILNAPKQRMGKKMVLVR
ncbi:Ig-like domain-containing protein [candidate division KSB1 bacterium]|nr:Ig-like domain-containing protein [candidate division KSB1 bacterium]